MKYKDEKVCEIPTASAQKFQANKHKKINNYDPTHLSHDFNNWGLLDLCQDFGHKKLNFSLLT